jgi:hypothetical protein
MALQIFCNFIYRHSFLPNIKTSMALDPTKNFSSLTDYLLIEYRKNQTVAAVTLNTSFSFF